jgi:hypothetical protein
MLGSSWVAAKLAAPQEGLSSVSEWMWFIMIFRPHLQVWRVWACIYVLSWARSFPVHAKGPASKLSESLRQEYVGPSESPEVGETSYRQAQTVSSRIFVSHIKGNTQIEGMFWDTTPCSPFKFNGLFGGACRFHLQCRRITRKRCMGRSEELCAGFSSKNLKGQDQLQDSGGS